MYLSQMLISFSTVKIIPQRRRPWPSRWRKSQSSRGLRRRRGDLDEAGKLPFLSSFPPSFCVFHLYFTRLQIRQVLKQDPESFLKQGKRERE
jgi:hypothetical protein